MSVSVSPVECFRVRDEGLMVLCLGLLSDSLEHLQIYLRLLLHLRPWTLIFQDFSYLSFGVFPDSRT